MRFISVVEAPIAGQKAVSLAEGNGTTAAQKSAQPAGSNKPRVLDFCRTKSKIYMRFISFVEAPIAGQKAISLAEGNSITAAQKSAKPAGSKKPRVPDFCRTKVIVFEIISRRHFHIQNSIIIEKQMFF